MHQVSPPRSLHSFLSFAHCCVASTGIPQQPKTTFIPSIQPNFGLPRNLPPLTSVINTLLAIWYSSILSTCPKHLNTFWSTLLSNYIPVPALLRTSSSLPLSIPDVYPKLLKQTLHLQQTLHLHQAIFFACEDCECSWDEVLRSSVTHYSITPVSPPLSRLRDLPSPAEQPVHNPLPLLQFRLHNSSPLLQISLQQQLQDSKSTIQRREASAKSLFLELQKSLHVIATLQDRLTALQAEVTH